MYTGLYYKSRTNYLGRFFKLYDTLLEFMDESDADLSRKLKESKHSIAYLTDIFGEFNILNKKLQGDGLNLFRAKTVINQFMIQLQIMKMQLKNHKFSKFPCLSTVNDEKRTSDVDLKVFCDHLHKLHTDMSSRFQDIIKLEIPNWIPAPLETTLHLSEMETITDVEEELLNLQNDFELHPKFAKSYQEFWLQKEVAIQYPALWEKVKILLIAFPTSYLVEKGFSSVSQLLGKQRLRLDIVNRGDLRLNLTNIQPDLEKIVSRHQVHPAHGKPAKAKEVVFKNSVTSKDI